MYVLYSIFYLHLHMTLIPRMMGLKTTSIIYLHTVYIRILQDMVVQWTVNGGRRGDARAESSP